ncbi:MAG: hypothetical protein HUJ63_12705 [Enterococcus sp.]|nr:hypothetical protein [Enterococcus sp.]
MTQKEFIENVKATKLLKAQNHAYIALRYVKQRAHVQRAPKYLPGQLLIFDYTNPIHKEELEYYDAQPCVLFFGVIQRREGKHVLGFNMHYFPHPQRERIFGKICEVFGIYKNGKINKKRAISSVAYKEIVKATKRYKLPFGVKEYAISHINNTYMVHDPAVGICTEGVFQKETMQKIYQFWRDFGK